MISHEWRVTSYRLTSDKKIVIHANHTLICFWTHKSAKHYKDVIVGAMASHITSLTFVSSTVYSDADQISTSLAFVRGIHRWPVNSPRKWPVTRKMFPFDDIIMKQLSISHLAIVAKDGLF